MRPEKIKLQNRKKNSSTRIEVFLSYFHDSEGSEWKKAAPSI